ILPLIISTLYHFIKHVFWGAMPFNDFTKDLGVYSYQPVMAFYKEMFAQLQMIITQQKTTPQP
ncbi:MAG TPA: hypothetical protein PKH98_04425, partial [Candidatus Omnitrophota bacterium]|nr:hypothetical protein [Candidatus Omnitrophota bacterium]